MINKDGLIRELKNEARGNYFPAMHMWRWQTVKDRQRRYEVSDEEMQEFAEFAAVHPSWRDIERYIHFKAAGTK